MWQHDIIIGAPFVDKVYIFTLDTTTEIWYQLATFTSQYDDDDEFPSYCGYSVSMTDGFAIFGCPTNFDYGAFAGKDDKPQQPAKTEFSVFFTILNPEK